MEKGFWQSCLSFSKFNSCLNGFVTIFQQILFIEVIYLGKSKELFPQLSVLHISYLKKSNKMIENLHEASLSIPF